MRTADKIASRILNNLKEYGFKNRKKDYLEMECMIADILLEEALSFEKDCVIGITESFHEFLEKMED